MKTLTINIGLNNNRYTKDQLIDRMASDSSYRLMAYQIVMGEFNNEPEETFVGLFEYTYTNQSKILSDFELLSADMTQECIALSTDSMDALAFSPSFKGARYKFNSEYFIKIVI